MNSIASSVIVRQWLVLLWRSMRPIATRRKFFCQIRQGAEAIEANARQSTAFTIASHSASSDCGMTRMPAVEAMKL
jgi:hypothetical protein